MSFSDKIKNHQKNQYIDLRRSFSGAGIVNSPCKNADFVFKWFFILLNLSKI